MEELQSTETLDREILEDARKKAFKILKTGDENAAISKAQWEKKLAAALDGLRESCRLREEKERHEIMARLPLDKRRIRLEKTEELLNGAMHDYLASLDRKKMLELLERELSLRLADSEAEGACTLYYRDLDREELDALAGTVLKQPFSKQEDTLYGMSGSFPALALDFPSLRINVSVDGAARSLLLDRRFELVSALLGETFEEGDCYD